MNRDEDYELTGIEEHLAYEMGAYGDARRCPVHPEVKTSSDDGMFDAPCYKCEGEMDDAAHAWESDPENPRRRYCGNDAPSLAPFGRRFVCCVEDEIPF